MPEEAMDAKMIFDNSVQVVMLGKPEGNFSPRGNRPFPRRLQPIRALMGVYPVIAPRCNFTTAWVEWPACDTTTWEATPHDVWWTQKGLFADGVKVTRGAQVIAAGFSADCPYAAVGFPSGEFGLCHLGLRCLVPKDGSRGILETAGIAADTQVYIIPGIGPCCYGERELGQFDDIYQRYPELRGTKIARGPRAGGRAIDLYRLIELILMERCGIERVSMDRRCTACDDTLAGDRLWYSHVYGETGRNLIAVAGVGSP